MSATTSFRVANHLSEIARAAGLVEAFGREHGLPARVLFDANLSVDEVLTNVISYGYDDDFEHTIEVRLALVPGGLRIEVEDDGRPFDPLAAPLPDLTAPIDERPIGGLGLCLVRKLMSSLAYERRDGRNVLTMMRRIDPATEREAR